MEESIGRMQKEIYELITWKNENPDVPEIVKKALNSYHNTLLNLIENEIEPPFEIGEDVELISSSYEDNGYFLGDTGKVRDIRTSVIPSGFPLIDILVTWDSGAEECWIAADDFS